MKVYRAIPSKGVSDILRPSSSFVYVLPSQVPAVFVAPALDVAMAWSRKLRFTNWEGFTMLELEVDFVHTWPEEFDDWCEETVHADDRPSCIDARSRLDYTCQSVPMVRTIRREIDWPRHETPEGLVPLGAIRSAKILAPDTLSF